MRYFLDRLNVSDPSAPKLLPAVNIPGQVVHFDEPSSRVLTIEHVVQEHFAGSWQPRTGGLRQLPPTDLERPVGWWSHDLAGWGCASLEVSGSRAYCALGEFGVASIAL